MSQSALPLSLLVAVNVILTAAGAQAQSLSNALVLGSSDVIDTTQRLRQYPTLTAVSQDFGNNTPEYLSAVLWFGQAPQPTNLCIGRWAQTATKGRLQGGALPTTILATLQAIINGGFHITIDAGSPTNITGLNFAADNTLNACAATIQAALTGATCTFSATQNAFLIESATTGATSAISFLTAPTAGTDISSVLNMSNTPGNGAYAVAGIAAESALSAVQTLDNQFPGLWYGLVVPGAADADHEVIAPYIEGASTKHVYGITSSEAGILSSVSTTDIAYIVNLAGYNRSFVEYSSTNPYASASVLGRLLTVDYGGDDTVLTMMYKQLPGVTPEVLSATQLAALLAKKANVYVTYNNGVSIFQNGSMASGLFMDEITDIDALAVSIGTDVFNLFFTTTTKIPQTDPGNHKVATVIEGDCAQAVTNGTLAPGQWNAPGFGALKQGDLLPQGFYVYAPAISSQSQGDRAARKSVSFQVACKLAGAIHNVLITMTVNQ